MLGLMFASDDSLCPGKGMWARPAVPEGRIRAGQPTPAPEDEAVALDLSQCAVCLHLITCMFPCISPSEGCLSGGGGKQLSC